MSWQRTLRRLRLVKPLVGGSYRRLVTLGMGSALSGFAEAGVLMVIIQLALTITGDGEATVTVGPLSLDLDPGPLLALGFGLTAFKLGLDVLLGHLTAAMTTSAHAVLRKQAFGAFMDASWRIQSAQPEGRLLDLLTTQVAKSSQVVMAVSRSFAAFFSFFALLVSALLIDPAAAGAILAAVVLLFFVLRPVSQLGKRYATAQAAAGIKYAKEVGESVNMVQEVQTFGVKDALSQRVRDRVDLIERIAHRARFWQNVLPHLYRTLAILLLLGGLALLNVTGTGSIASLSAIILLLLRAVGYGQQLQTNYHMLSDSSPYYSNIRRSLAEYRSDVTHEDGAPLAVIETVAFDSVSFSYVPGSPALDHVSFSVPRGEVVGVVGPSGAGKSTLVQILLRLRSPDTGRFLVNGADAGEFSLHDWRKLVAFVPQEPRLFDATIRENIDFFRSLPADAVEAAARAAHVHDEIESFPDGYTTLAGRNGANLSGGQRQRVAIARALAHGPGLLVLDEPTSALDPHSEALIQQTLLEWRGRVTMFVIAHRMSTLNVCDRILVLRAGRVERFDRAENLLRSDNFYREAVELSRP